ncbi:helix-turn-helix transcriptional regulator [bacterium]|nr:helix-turn-helix transcriptional regulator [bacterium]
MTPTERLFLRRADSLVHRHLCDSDFSVAVFAEKAGISRSQLHRKLTALTGGSASAFVRIRRLKRAVQLMERGGQPFSVIARQAGFNNMAYFRKCFKEMYRVTPSEYVQTI